MSRFIQLANQFIYCVFRWLGWLGGILYLYSLQHELFGYGSPIPTEEDFIALIFLFASIGVADFFEQVMREREEQEEEDYE